MTLATAAYRGDQLTGVGTVVTPSGWTAGATIQSHTSVGIDSTDQYRFPAGTEVLLADGTAKPIEQIQLGDQVAVATQTAVTTPTALPQPSSLSLNRNLYLNLPPSGQVTQLHRNTTTELYHLHLGDHKLTTTAGHPFYEATTKSWTLAGDLLPGNRLIDQQDVELTITAITTEVVPPTAIYNFAVAEHHQYHVRLPGTDHFVLVHNDSFGLNTYGSSLVPTIVASFGIDIDLSKQQQEKLAEIMAEFLVTMADTANAVVDNAVPVALTVLGGVGAAYSISAGVSMIAAGGSLSGIAAGTTLVALGSDGLQSSVRTLLSGEYHPTYVQQGLTNLGLSQNEALLAEIGLSLLAPSAAGRLAGRIDSARAAAYARSSAGRLDRFAAAERAGGTVGRTLRSTRRAAEATTHTPPSAIAPKGAAAAGWTDDAIDAIQVSANRRLTPAVEASGLRGWWRNRQVQKAARQFGYDADKVRYVEEIGPIGNLHPLGGVRNKHTGEILLDRFAFDRGFLRQHQLPNYRTVLAHEVGHQYGLPGSGFTSINPANAEEF